MQCVIYLTATAALTQRVAAGRRVTAVSLQCKQILSLYHNISNLNNFYDAGWLFRGVYIEDLT